MKLIRRSFAILVFASGWFVASAQTIMDQLVQNSHLVAMPPPVYPPIALAAHVTGQVTLSIEVGPDGDVHSVQVVSGPPMLRTAAVDAVRQARYRPFEVDGKPATVKFNVMVPFSLVGGANVAATQSELLATKKDNELGREYFALSDTCHKLFAENAQAAEQEKSCGQAAAKADEFAADARYIERRSAYVYASTAAMRNKDFPQALQLAQKAVGVVQLGHDDGSGSSAAYQVLGQAEAFSGQLKDADRDLTKAESFERSALAKIDSAFLKQEYRSTLNGLLGFHANVLKALGRNQEADALMKEASSSQ